MNFEDICRIGPAEKYNKELEAFLSETPILPLELLHRFNDAYSYDSATTIQWLIRKLSILRSRIEKGERIETEDGYLFDVDQFMQWVENLYPDIYHQLFDKTIKQEF